MIKLEYRKKKCRLVEYELKIRIPFDLDSVHFYLQKKSKFIQGLKSRIDTALHSAYPLLVFRHSPPAWFGRHGHTMAGKESELF